MCLSQQYCVAKKEQVTIAKFDMTCVNRIV